MVTASIGVQTDLPKVVHSSCRPVCHSSELQTPSVCVSYPRPKDWDIDALNINWTGLTVYAYPPMAVLHRVIQKIRQCHCLIIVIAPGWPGMAGQGCPGFGDLVQLSTEIPLQLPVSTTLLKQHNHVFHSNPQHLNLHAWCLGVDNSKASLWRWAERIAAPQRSSTRTIYKSKWALSEKWCRENSVDFSTPSVKHISDFFMYLYQDLNRCPSTIDGYRTAIADTVEPNWNLSVVLNERHRPQTSYSQNCFLASFGLQQVPQQNPCLGCKQSI